MPKNSTSGRGKVSLLLCAVSFLTASVIFSVGLFSTKSKTKELLGLGSQEEPHRGRVLLSVLKNWTLSRNASRDRADELWSRFLEKVKKAVGRLATSSATTRTTTTTTTKTSRRRRSSTVSRVSRSVATTATAAAEPTPKDDGPDDGGIATVGYGWSVRHATPGIANESERLRRTPIVHGRGVSLATPKYEISAFFDRVDGFASNSSYSSTTSDSEEAATNYTNVVDPKLVAGTKLATGRGDGTFHQETILTDYFLPSRGSHQRVSDASTIRWDTIIGLENSSEEVANKSTLLEARGPGVSHGVSDNRSSGSTVSSSGIQERGQGLVAAGTSYAWDELKPREALELVKAHVETGSAIFRDGIDWIEERLPSPSASDVAGSSSNLSAVETVLPTESPRRGITAEGQRLFANGAAFALSDRREGLPDIGSGFNVSIAQPNRNSTEEVADIEANVRRQGSLSDIYSSFFLERDARKTTSGTDRSVGMSDWRRLESIPETATDEDLPPTKTAKYKGSNRKVNDALANTIRPGQSETGLLPEVVHTNGSDASLGLSSADRFSPVSGDEQHPLAKDPVTHFSPPTPSETGIDVQPPHTGSYISEATSSDVKDERSFITEVLVGKQFVSEIPEGAKIASTGKTLGNSGGSDDKGVGFQGDGSTERHVTKLNETLLPEIEAADSKPPLHWSPAVRIKVTGRYRITDSAGAGTEPFEEIAQPEEVPALTANKNTSTAAPTLYSQRDTPERSTQQATDSRESELFDLSRELDRIAHEFTQFLESKAKGSQGSSSGSSAPTSAGAEESHHVDEEIVIVGQSDGAPAGSTSAIVGDLSAPTIAHTHIGNYTSGSADTSTVSQAREEEELPKEVDEETTTSAARTGLMTETHTKSQGGQIYCSVGPAYTGPLPPALCSYFLVYSAVEYNSNRKSFQVASKGSWRAMVSKANHPRMGPHVLLVLNATQVQNLVADFPVSAVFVTKAQSFIEAQGLWGLTFDLSLVTDFDARSHAMLFRELKGSLLGYHFVGLMDFFAASGLLRANLAELVGSVHKVFLRHDPQRVYTIGTSVPNPFASPNRRSYSVENAMRLAESLRLVSPDHNQVCLSVSLAVYKFSIYTLDANYSSPGVGSLAFSVNTGFSYSEFCKNYKGLHTHFDDASLSTYVHKGSAWLGFDDDMSMEIKIDKLSRGHRVGCLLADHIDLDDFKNVCKKGDFPRLRLLKRTFTSRERR